MLQIKKRTQQDRRAAPTKKILSQIKEFLANKTRVRRNLVIGVVILFLFLGAIYNVFANNTGYWTGLNVDNYITVTIHGPDGESGTMKVGFSNSYDYNRDDFIKESHPVRVKNLGSSGKYELDRVNQAVQTTLTDPDKNNKRWYEVVTYDMTFKLPAHYKISSYTASRPDPDSRNNVSLNYATNTHANQETTVTISNNINLKQTGMITYDGSTDASGRRFANIDIYLTRDKYTLTLYDQFSSPWSNSYYCGTETNLAPRSRNGYIFNGWYANNVKYDSVTMCQGNRSFTANWTPYKHKVSYNLQGGNFPSSSKSQTTLDGCKIIPNGTYSIQSSLNADRYLHVNSANGETQTNALVTYDGCSGDQAKWIFERYKDTQYYTITSYYNGLALELSGDPSYDDPLYNAPIELYYPKKPADDYLWYLKDAGNGKVNIYNKSSEQLLNITNGEDKNNAIIKQYVYNGSNAQKFNLIAVSQQDYPDKQQYGDHGVLVNSVIPERKNYTFSCWNTKPDGSGTSYTQEDVYTTITYDWQPVTLYAIWSPGNFKVTFNANGGSGSIKDVTHKGFESFILPNNGFVRNGYVFIGWSLEKYPDEISYKDKDSYENRIPEATLYAQWRKIGTGFIQRPFMDAKMFYKTLSILGGNGTVYDREKIDSRMAHVDTKENPGYFSVKK